MIDDEKVDKNKENLKKSKAGYNPYDQEEIDEASTEKAALTLAIS